jgi:hypothetical protein
MGTEIGFLQPDPTGVGLHEVTNALVGEALVRESTTLATGRNSGPSVIPASDCHALTAFTGQAWWPRTMAI